MHKPEEDLLAINAELRRRNEELRRSKEEIERYERQYILMLESLKGYALYMLDPEGVVTTWNSPSAAIEGYATKEIIGKPFALFYTPEDCAVRAPEKMLAEAQANGRAERVGWRVRKDGSRFFSSTTIAPMIGDEDARLMGFVVVTRDLTEQKAIEDARDTLLKELKIRAGGHTQKLAGQIESAASAARKLREREEELSDTDKKKNHFISILSHELRNPLAAILSSAEVLQLELAEGKNAPPQAAAKEASDAIVRQVKKVAHLLDDLLDVSRVLLNKMQLRREAIDLRGVIRHAVETTSPSFKAKRVALEVSLPEQALPLHADPVRTEQVFGNILDNAAKYSKDGSRVSLHAGREGSSALVRIRDEGIGIQKELLPDIFDLFSRSTQPGVSMQSGLGIGLALSKEIVELHGGTITASSAGEGAGSEFTVRLPLAE